MIGQGEIDETQTALFAIGVERYVLREDLVASLHALETPVSELFEGRRTKQVAPFLLPTLFRRRHSDVPSTRWSGDITHKPSRLSSQITSPTAESIDLINGVVL